MIKATDLRIGNYVKDKKYPITYKVTAIGENGGWMQVTDEFEDIDSAIEKLEPIPLTEEWLIKLGLIKDEWSYTFPINGGNTAYSIECYGDKFGFAYGGEVTKETWITSVSQLQNLYYFLTGEELVLNKIN